MQKESVHMQNKNNVKKAVVIGAGFIGLEAAENLQAKGIQVTVIDFADQILPNIFDPEMALYAKKTSDPAGNPRAYRNESGADI